MDVHCVKCGRGPLMFDACECGNFNHVPLELSDPKEEQNDWRTDPLNPATQQPAVTSIRVPPVPSDIIELIHDEPSRLKTWLLACGLTQDEWFIAMTILAEKACRRAV